MDLKENIGGCEVTGGIKNKLMSSIKTNLYYSFTSMGELIDSSLIENPEFLKFENLSIKQTKENRKKLFITCNTGITYFVIYIIKAAITEARNAVVSTSSVTVMSELKNYAFSKFDNPVIPFLVGFYEHNQNAGQNRVHGLDSIILSIAECIELYNVKSAVCELLCCFIMGFCNHVGSAMLFKYNYDNHAITVTETEFYQFIMFHNFSLKDKGLMLNSEVLLYINSWYKTISQKTKKPAKKKTNVVNAVEDAVDDSGDAVDVEDAVDDSGDVEDAVEDSGDVEDAVEDSGDVEDAVEDDRTSNGSND